MSYHDLQPPTPPGRTRAIVLALVAHLLLVLALTWGVQWRRKAADAPVFEAELWSKLPAQSAPPPQPPAVVPTPSPEPVPVPVPRSTPKPAPIPKPAPLPKPAPPPTAAPGPSAADIALAKEKKHQQELEHRQQEELAKKKLTEKQEREKEKEKEKEKEEKRKAQEKKHHAEVLEKEKMKEKEKEKAAKEAKDAKEKTAKKEKEKKEAKEAEDERKRNMDHAMKLAGASDSSQGSAQKSSAPSAGYSGILADRVKKNIVFSDVVAGNPAAVIEAVVASDGTILSARTIKPSGIPAWDEAVIRAILKTEKLPKDGDKAPPSRIPFIFRPNDVQ